jgi:hypothetical protein
VFHDDHGTHTRRPAFCHVDNTLNHVPAPFPPQASLPSFASADEADDAIYQIAEKTRLKNEAAKKKEMEKLSKRRDNSKDNEGADLIVKGAIGASFFLSLPFFYKNLARLGLKFSSVVNKNIKEEDFKR